MIIRKHNGSGRLNKPLAEAEAKIQSCSVDALGKIKSVTLRCSDLTVRLDCNEIKSINNFIEIRRSGR